MKHEGSGASLPPGCDIQRSSTSGLAHSDRIGGRFGGVSSIRLGPASIRWPIRLGCGRFGGPRVDSVADFGGGVVDSVGPASIRWSIRSEG